MVRCQVKDLDEWWLEEMEQGRMRARTCGLARCPLARYTHATGVWIESRPLPVIKDPPFSLGT